VPSCTARLIHSAGAVATFSFPFADTESVDPPAGGRVSEVPPNWEARKWSRPEAEQKPTNLETKFPAAARAARRIPAHYPQDPTWCTKQERDRPNTKQKAQGKSKRAQRRSFFWLANKTEGRQNNDFSVSLAAAAVLTPGVECVALKELRAQRARILPSNRLLDALDLSRKKMLVVARCLRVEKFSGEFCQPFSWQNWVT